MSESVEADFVVTIEHSGMRLDQAISELMPDYSRSRLQQWIKHHFKGKKLSLNIVGTLMDVQGIEAMVTSHMGAGIIPLYRLNANPEVKKNLQIFRGPGGKLQNTISLAYLKNRRHDLAIDSLIIHFTKSFNH